MTKSITQTIDDLRGKLAASQGLQSELNAEIQEVSFLAHTGDIKSQKRLDEIRTALSKVDIEIRSLTAALATAANMQVAEQDAARAELQRANASQAEGMIAEAELIAQALDKALLEVRDNAVAYEAKMVAVRRLIGYGPNYEIIRIFLVRALQTALHRGPLHIISIAPGERTTAQQASNHWAASIRNMIASTLQKTAAKKAA
jgi:hypothetical protein